MEIPRWGLTLHGTIFAMIPETPPSVPPSSKPLPILVRKATSSDLEALATFEVDYTTDYVWQVDLLQDGDRQHALTFRQVRLPRTLRATAPRDLSRVLRTWQDRRLFIVAERRERPVGFMAIDVSTLDDVGWIADFAVDRSHREQGVGKALLTSAMSWAAQVGVRRLIMELQAKNNPAISFARKHGFLFAGYNTDYYPGQDMALYFGRSL